MSALPKLPAGVYLRVTCSECGRSDVAVTKRGTIGDHNDERRRYYAARRCDGVASAVAPEALRASLDEARSNALTAATNWRAAAAKAAERAESADAQARALAAVVEKLAKVTS